MTRSLVAMMSFKGSLSENDGKNNLAVRLISNLIFPFATKYTVSEEQPVPLWPQGLYSTALRRHLLPQWLPFIGFLPSNDDVKIRFCFLLLPQEVGSPCWFQPDRGTTLTNRTLTFRWLPTVLVWDMHRCLDTDMNKGH